MTDYSAPGVRIVVVSLTLIERVFEEGVDQFVPIDALENVKILDARMSSSVRDAVEMLVQSWSFPASEAGASWLTARRHDQSFRRWTKDGLWSHGVPPGHNVRMEYTGHGGEKFEAALPPGAVEISGVDLSDPPSAMIRLQDGNYRHLPLSKVAPSEPSEGPPI